MPRILIEVAMETAEDAIAAEAGGADRLELCSALDLGGLTPSRGMYETVRDVSRLPVYVMIRPRGGDFVYSSTEIRVMQRDIAYFLPLKPDGFVFGVLRSDATIHREACRELVRAATGVACTFHRAFDRCGNRAQALDECVALGFKRILTSGRAADAVAGLGPLKQLADLARDRIGLLPCGRIRAANVGEIVRQTGCQEVHGSFAEPVSDSQNEGERGSVQRSRTSRTAVAACRAALDSPQLEGS